MLNELCPHWATLQILEMVFWKGSHGWWNLSRGLKVEKYSGSRKVFPLRRHSCREGNHQGLKSKLGQSTCMSSFPSYSGHIRPDHNAFQVFESLSEICTFYKHQYQHFTRNLTSLYMVHSFSFLFLNLLLYLFRVESRECFGLIIRAWNQIWRAWET